MRHIKQKPYECFPTVLAMLLDKTPGYVTRQVVQAIGPCYPQYKVETWLDVIGLLNYRYWRDAKLRKLISDTLTKLVPWVPIDMLIMPEALHLSTNVNSVPTGLPGTGVITIRGINGTRHIVTYQDNMVFDPEQSSPMPWKEWLEHLSRINFRVQKIVPKGE